MATPRYGRRRCPFVSGMGGQLALAFAMASCSGAEAWIAPKCGPQYMLGCVGDGRPDSQTTPGSVPKRSCAKADLALFNVHVTTSQPREEIVQCRVAVIDPSGETLARYTLASNSSEMSGSGFGCVLGQTHAEVGYLSYSSCCAEQEELRFQLEALSATEDVLQAASATASCAYYPPEVSVELRAQPTQ